MQHHAFSSLEYNFLVKTKVTVVPVPHNGVTMLAALQS